MRFAPHKRANELVARRSGFKPLQDARPFQITRPGNVLSKQTWPDGSFIPWLQSVIRHREELSALVNNRANRYKARRNAHVWNDRFGAISSFGADLEACANAPQKVVYFNEILGSVPSAVDAIAMIFVDVLKQAVNVTMSVLSLLFLFIHRIQRIRFCQKSASICA